MTYFKCPECKQVTLYISNRTWFCANCNYTEEEDE